MKCLVVIAHPLTDSLCSHLADSVVEQLTSSNHDVVVKNLYSSEFDPSLTGAERKAFYRDSYDFSGVVEDVTDLKEAEGLVLVFPTWWFGFPAILKGWFDRVWVPGIAYDHAKDRGPITPRLHQLRETLVVTTLGSPRWVDRLVMRQPVKRVIKTAILYPCARKSRLKYLSLYNSEDLNASEVESFKMKISRCLDRWKP